MVISNSKLGWVIAGVILLQLISATFPTVWWFMVPTEKLQGKKTRPKPTAVPQFEAIIPVWPLRGSAGRSHVNPRFRRLQNSTFFARKNGTHTGFADYPETGN